MSSQIIKDYEAAQLRSDVPDFKPGDSLRISVKITEGDKERIQEFEGVCIRRKGGGINETITIRRVSYGVGMERIFPIHSPKVDKIQVVRHGKVRRAKLYYLRDLSGKKARIVERKNPDGTPMRVARVSAKDTKAAAAKAAAEAASAKAAADAASAKATAEAASAKAAAEANAQQEQAPAPEAAAQE